MPEGLGGKSRPIHAQLLFLEVQLRATEDNGWAHAISSLANVQGKTAGYWQITVSRSHTIVLIMDRNEIDQYRYHGPELAFEQRCTRVGSGGPSYGYSVRPPNR